MGWKTKYIVAPIIVGIVLIVVGYYITQYLNQPKIVPSVQPYTTEFCPQGIAFNYDIASFSVNYMNSGANDADVTVTLTSDNVLSKYTDSMQDYQVSSSKGWYIIKGQSGKYDFSLKINNSNQPPSNITIEINQTCSYGVTGNVQFDCGFSLICCKYNKTYSNNYNFIGGICQS